MSEKFQNKYRIPSARLQNWDYGWNAAYFVTICTQDRECYLGDTVNGKMQLSETGNLADEYWNEIPNHFPFVKLDVHVVMPNHVHGIIEIHKNNVETRLIASKHHDHDGNVVDCANTMGERTDTVARRTDAINRVSTEKPKTRGGITGNKNPMLHDNLSRIIRWYKGRITFESRKMITDFAWQTRFHDHIIRDADQYQRIRNLFGQPLFIKCLHCYFKCISK